MNQGVDYFQRGHWLTRLQEKVSFGARRRMFELALKRLSLKSGDAVIDLGATPDVERIDSNCMIPWYSEAGLRVTISSPEEISHLKKVFPFADIIQNPDFHQPVPVKDGAYTLATSSAVLEHCGNEDFQQKHLQECGRIAEKIFLTTPNRWHWLEFHTKIPLLHWLPKSLHRFLLKQIGYNFWAQEKNLNLLSKAELEKLAKQALPDFQVKVRTIWTLLMPSNLILLAQRRNTLSAGNIKPSSNEAE
jgi:hypothetical protein